MLSSALPVRARRPRVVIIVGFFKSSYPNRCPLMLVDCITEERFLLVAYLIEKG